MAKYLAVVLHDISALKDGVLLCQLLNVMRKNTIRMVHVPQGNDPLSPLKASRNLSGFVSFAQLQFGRVSFLVVLLNFMVDASKLDFWDHWGSW